MNQSNLQSPFYRIREQDLLYDIRLLKNALEENWGNYIMSYSVKTNSLPWLLNYLRKQGFFAEVVSAQEYDLAKRLGFESSHTVYNSPVKSRAVWEEILRNGGYVNLDSHYELDWLKELSTSHPEKLWKVGLRVNCDLAALCPEEQLVESDGGRFGYCYENGVLEKTVLQLKELKNVQISGLHLHSSTQSRTVNVYGALAKMAVKIAKEYQLKLDYVDMGGGYFGGRDDKPQYPDYFAEICKELKEYFNPEHTKLIVEPGVSLISRATTFETTVLDYKDIRGIRYVVTDGSRVNLNPLVTRHVYPHHIEYCPEISTRTVCHTQWVCGASCMEYDRLFEIKDDVELQPGDKIIYDTAGGYTICLNPLFIHYFPAVFVEKTDGSLFEAREPWTNDEYIQKNHWEQKG